MTEENELEDFGDTGIQSLNAPIPRWLWATYIILPIWGVLSFAVYWNGTVGWLDRGYWYQLQKAANTKFPEVDRGGAQFVEGQTEDVGKSIVPKR